MTIATIRHEIGRRIFAFTWGSPKNTYLRFDFRFGRLHGAFGLRGFTIWFRKYDGPCHLLSCEAEGFYSLRTRRTYCNRHVTLNARD